MCVPAKSVGVWLIIAGVLMARLVLALDPDKPITQYQLDFWGQEEGLPQISVQALVQTKEGYIWIGTRDGLARFDGTKFTVYRSEEYSGLRSDDIRSLNEDSQGRLWIGTFNGGVSWFEKGSFNSCSVKDGLGSKGVLAIHEDRQGNIWFGTWQGVARYNSGRFETYGRAEGVKGKSGWSFAEDGGVLWLATERSIHTFRDGRFEVKKGFVSGDIHDLRKILVARDGTMWIGTLNGLIRVRNGEQKLFTTSDGLADNRVRTMAEDTDSNIWVGTWEGLSRIQGEEVSSSPSRSGERLNAVIDALLVDTDGSLWIGFRGGGLGRLRDAKFSNFTTREGLPSKLPRCVFQSRSGAIWVGTDGGGLAKIEEQKVTQITKSDGLPSDFVASIAEDKEGKIWLGLGRPAAIGVLNNGRIEKVIGTAEGLPFEYSVRALYFDRTGTLWAGGDGGLCRIRTNQVELVRGLPTPPVRVIAEDCAGKLWVGTDDGLCVLEGTSIDRIVTTADGLAHNAVYSFYQDRSGDIWLGTQQGFTQFKNGKFRSLSKTMGGFQGTIYSVLDDDDGKLWISSSRGISAFPKSSIEAALSGEVPVAESVTFGTADGLKSTQGVGGSQSPACKSSDGRLWFATLNGIAVARPQEPDPHVTPPPVVVEEMRANRVSFVTDKENRFAADTDDFEFHYAAIRFITPEKVRFRYQLVGHDREWIPAETRRTAYYNNLRPGPYHFQVSASVDGRQWSVPVQTASFILLPHFYQTGWFYSCAVALFAACGLGFHFRRLRKQKEQFTLVLAERTRIARELHDTMAQGFAGTAFQLEALRSSIGNAGPETKRHLDLALTMVRHSFGEAKRAVMNLRSPGLENGSLVSAVSEMGKQMFLDTNLELSIRTAGKPENLEGETEQQLLRICQEALANVIKHANATRVELAFDFETKPAVVSIRDNGRGFDPQCQERTKGAHFGLLGIRERVKQIGGTVQINSAPGQGTEILVHLN